MIQVPIKVGDIVLGGKFKNRKITVKTIETNERGDIQINGKNLLNVRIIEQPKKENKGEEKMNYLEKLKKMSYKVGDKVHSPSGFGKIIAIKGDKVIVRSNDPSGDFEYPISKIRKE